MTAPDRPGAPRSSSSPRATPRLGTPRPPARRRESIASQLSWRAVVLTAVVALALAVMVPSIRAYVRQQDALVDLRGQVADARTEADDLEAEAARWNDPAYVMAQARGRLGYILPGETAFRVVDPEFVRVPEPTPGQGVAADDPPPRPWFATLWGSIEAAAESP